MLKSLNLCLIPSETPRPIPPLTLAGVYTGGGGGGSKKLFFCKFLFFGGPPKNP